MTAFGKCVDVWPCADGRATAHTQAQTQTPSHAHAQAASTPNFYYQNFVCSDETKISSANDLKSEITAGLHNVCVTLDLAIS